MDEPIPYDDSKLPWDLLVPALEGELSSEQNLLLNQWLDADPANQETLRQLTQLYGEAIDDYPLYLAAEEDKAWSRIQSKLVKAAPVLSIKFWAGMAAILLLIVGSGWWFLAEKNNLVVYTTSGAPRTVTLPDGSIVEMSAHSHLELTRGYGKTNRSIMFISGRTRFDVAHQKDLPFEVDLDGATVRDIGTSFIVDKTTDSISVTVTSGRISFTSKKDGTARQIDAGGAIRLNTDPVHAGEIKETTTSVSLHFDNTPLVLILDGLEKRSGKNILLADSADAQRRLTVDLEGETFENALDVICTSAGLKYTLRGGIYVLQQKAP